MKRIFLYCICFFFLPVFCLTQEAKVKTMPLYSSLLTDDGSPTPALLQLLNILSIPESRQLDDIVENTQKRWIQRQKERWEFDPLEEDKKEQLIPLFSQLGLFKELRASNTHYDYALVYGGFYTRVIQRIQHLIEEYKRGIRFNEIVFLTGERLLDLNTCEKDFGLRTETEMMLLAWNQAHVPQEMRQLPLHVVHTRGQLNKDGSWKRPTTKETLLEWLKTQPKPGRCLFISNQPFCGYQDTIARTYLPTDFIIETIGMQSDENLSISIYLDNLARWLYSENVRRKTL